MKPYTEKHNARRGAKKNLGPDAVEGVDFTIEQSSDGWRWKAVERPAGVAPTVYAAERRREENARDLARIERKHAPKPQDGQVAPAARQTKGGTVLRLLKREGGATNAEIREATGWQEHTVRGFFAGKQMKRTGYRAERFQREGGESAYRAVKAEG